MSLIKNLSNIPGWRTKRQLIAIESDDWGSIRMPSMEVFTVLENNGIDLTNDEGYVFNKYDSLASENDLSLLFEVLLSVRDSVGRPAVLTPFCVVANPDFEKIRISDFTEYYYKPFTEELSETKGCEGSFALWKQGIEEGIFVPQFHGREHLNVKVWMKALRSSHSKTMLAFDNGIWGISTAMDPDIGVEFQAAFDFLDKGDLDYQKEIIGSGLDLFEQLFGYRAVCFVPPNGIYSNQLESFCLSQGIKMIGVSKNRLEPVGRGKYGKKIHWLGQWSNSGLRYITRNCLFEPSQQAGDWVDSCLKDISTAFRWNKPAVISTHRVNYIGSHSSHNRENGLRQLNSLLRSIVKQWPRAEFISTGELVPMICNE